jgi:GNAT superfamily N-acetyltransferase
MTPTSIRIADLEDAEKITILINTAFQPAEGFFVVGDRIDPEGVRTFLKTGRFLLAENKDCAVGCVYVEPRTTDNARAYLGLLAVDPASQHSGLGSLLMQAAEDYCRGLGSLVMDIKVVNLREELMGFYQQRGYVETGTSAFPEHIETKVPCHFIEMSKPLAS